MGEEVLKGKEVQMEGLGFNGGRVAKGCCPLCRRSGACSNCGGVRERNGGVKRR